MTEREREEKRMYEESQKKGNENPILMCMYWKSVIKSSTTFPNKTEERKLGASKQKTDKTAIDKTKSKH